MIREKRNEGTAAPAPSRLGGTLKWIFAGIVAAWFAFTVFVAVEITLSYFPWSPFGYEPCGLQGVAWPLMVYPSLLFNFLARIGLCWSCRLPRSYLLPPVIIAFICFLPISLTCNSAVAIGFTLISIFAVLFFAFLDFRCIRHPRPAKTVTSEITR